MRQPLSVRFIRFVHLLLAFLIVSFWANTESIAEMQVILPQPKSYNDVRYLYDRELLELALKETDGEFGPFEISFAPAVMTNKRTKRSLIEGRMINIMRSPPPMPNWKTGLCRSGSRFCAGFWDIGC